MKPHTTDKLFQYSPGLKRVLHECSGCHTVGLKPGILNTKHGDYGMRGSIDGKYEELHLGTHGFCDHCAEEMGLTEES